MPHGALAISCTHTGQPQPIESWFLARIQPKRRTICRDRLGIAALRVQLGSKVPMCLVIVGSDFGNLAELLDRIVGLSAGCQEPPQVMASDGMGWLAGNCLAVMVDRFV